MTAQGSGYSVDTSSLIDGIKVYYRPENFPRLWGFVDELIVAGRFFISDFVADEVKTKDDDVHDWVAGRPDSFVIESDGDVLNRAKLILSTHPKLVKEMQNRTRADLFVIALAQQQDAIVVTGERPGSANRPKIPDVCADLGVECLSLPNLVAREGWTF